MRQIALVLLLVVAAMSGIGWFHHGMVARGGFTNQYSATFDGADDYVDLGTPSDLNLTLSTQQLTISLWAKRTDAGGSETDLLSRFYTGAATVYSLILFWPASASRSYASNASYSEAGNPTANAWHHWLYVVSGAGAVTLYLDNSAGTGGTAGSGTLATTKWLLSCRWTSSGMSAVSNCWKGQIDEVSFWSVAFSASERAEIYNSGKPNDLLRHSRAASLLHWYRMGDGDTYPTVTDRKGSANGTATNMAGAANFALDVP